MKKYENSNVQVTSDSSSGVPTYKEVGCYV